MRTCAYDVGEGSNFCHFGAYVLIEWPQSESIVTLYLKYLENANVMQRNEKFQKTTTTSF